ncbi:beta-glucosidase [Niveomyces insectorum RCEF 264]|uniref:beta-glucosidase n=1 Tax=Niveomyces insectorum RCEF 264 TaxID=1081102 RepID=A0A167TAC8_9HYPO|nr:beta-glucosidase [Niveomyces insectorum RCEF 264]
MVFSSLWQSGLLGLALLSGSAAVKAELITSDTHFYGQSPPVYPTPNGNGTGNWADAYAQARALVAQMTLTEKVSLTGGIEADNGCSGTIPAIPRLHFPGLCLSDAGNGLRSTDFVSSWPSGISVGASWNRNLTRQRAVGMAGEFRAKGVNVALGPVAGPLGRIAVGGRNWEGFSNDPYLSGQLVFQTVKGFQETGVITSTKHFIGNEQETNRYPEGNVSAVSSNIDDKTLHELYLWPFQDAVYAGTGNIMCAYNRVQNSYSCANSQLLNGILKTELGFQGFVVSDWGAQHAGVATALAGLDMTMPSGSPFWADNLTTAVNNGSVPVERLDDMVTRIVATWYQMKQDQPTAFNGTNGQNASFPVPGSGMPRNLALPHQAVVGRSRQRAARRALRDGAVEGHVLVKNINGALPFNRSAPPQLLSVFGYGAKTPDVFNPNDEHGWNDGSYVEANGGPGHPQIAGLGTLVSGGGSGANEPAYIDSPLDALRTRARRDGTNLFWDVRPVPRNGTADYPAAVDPASDACIVVGNAYASEGWDRVGLHDDYTDGLILHVAARCRNTIVVLHNAGLRLVDQFVDHPNVTALFFAHLPGQDAGDALVRLLYGAVNPSGKLPYTVPRNESQLGALANATVPGPAAADDYALFPQSDFTEGIYTDYRAFDLLASNATSATPRYPFGFGLSYTTFGFANANVTRPMAVVVPPPVFNYTQWGNSTDLPPYPTLPPPPPPIPTPTLTATGTLVGTDVPSYTPVIHAPYPLGPVVEGGNADLWDIVATVTAEVTNTGPVAGAEVAQLYVVIPDGLVRQLRGFEKVYLRPGETATVTFPLTRRDLSTWDPSVELWWLQRGLYDFYVGSSSRHLPLKVTVRM